MTNYKKISWQRIAIILLIAVFSIAGFISCKKKPTEPSNSSQTEVPDQGTGGSGITVPDAPIIDGDNNGESGNTGGDNSGNTGGESGNTGGESGNTGGESGNTGGESGNTGSDNNEGYQPVTNPEWYTKDKLYTIYIPWALEGHDYAVVSYQDTNVLDKLWKKHITRAGANDGKEFFIKNQANRRSIDSFKSGNDYYYFDENFDVIFKAHETKGGQKYILKKYLGAVITWYKGGDYIGTYTIGGLYRTEPTKSDYYGWNDDGINQFMRYKDKGHLELIVLNTGHQRDKKIFGVNLYYTSDSYKNNPNYSPWLYDTTRFLGKRPESFMEKLGYAFLSDVGEYFFVPGDPEISRSR